MPIIKPLDLALDSGAFSVESGTAKKITLEGYAEYLHRYSNLYSMSFNLDVINNGQGSYRNWTWLRRQGLDVIPVYHIGTDEKYLQRYLRQTDFVGIGAIANLHTSYRLKGLDHVWQTYMQDSKGDPTHYVHGMGLTSPVIMLRYPWYSSDSVAAARSGGYGVVALPNRLRCVKGKFKEDTKAGWRYVGVSTRKGVRTRVQANPQAHFARWPSEVQKQYRDYIIQRGFEVGDITPIDQEGHSLMNKEGAKIDKSRDMKTLAGDYIIAFAWNVMFLDRWNKLQNNRIRIYHGCPVSQMRPAGRILGFDRTSFLTSFARIGNDREGSTLHKLLGEMNG